MNYNPEATRLPQGPDKTEKNQSNQNHIDNESLMFIVMILML